MTGTDRNTYWHWPVDGYRQSQIKIQSPCTAGFGVIFTPVAIVVIVVSEVFNRRVRGKILTGLIGDNRPLLASKSGYQVTGLAVIRNKVQLHLPQVSADADVFILLVNSLVDVIMNFDHFDFIGKVGWNHRISDSVYIRLAQAGKAFNHQIKIPVARSRDAEKLVQQSGLHIQVLINIFNFEMIG